MEMMTSAWRSLMYGASAAGSAAADVAVGRKILEKIQLALLQAFQKHGAHALSADEIAPIKALCDQLLPAHFQLSVPDAQATAITSAAARRKARCVRYQHIWEDDNFSMGIFILPPGASIPLHDHPEMSVISRVLYGNLYVKACDIVPQKEVAALVNQQHFISEQEALPSQPQIIARMCADQVITAPYTTELLPDRGNLHEFVAGDAMGCAIFDILTPPYEPDDGRDCTYYRFVGGARVSASGAANGEDADGAFVALEIFDPEDFEVASEPYLGPQLAPHVNGASGGTAPGMLTASSSSSMSSGSSSP